MILKTKHKDNNTTAVRTAGNNSVALLASRQELLELIKIYLAIKRNCYDKNYINRTQSNKSIIKIDDSFGTVEKFISWAYISGYSPGKKVVRLDDEEDYSPANCTWVNGRG